MSVTISDIQNARKVLKGVINETPILPDKAMSNLIGTNVFLKAECLQRSGSFKIRGAYNTISRLSEEEKERGVIAASAGNHAQGVALAAKLLGIKSTIVLPEFAPLTKVNATKKFGAEAILYGTSFDEAVAHSKELQKKHGFTYVHAFENENVIAGQGTIGLEIAEDLPETTILIVPIGGGGIISGIAIAAKHFLPNVKIIGVEAENLAVIKPSLNAGKPIEMSHKSTIADGIAIKRPGEFAFGYIKNLVEEIIEVTEEEIADGIFHCVQNNHLVVEGAGAAGVAALLAGKIEVNSNDTVCTVLCGGNIDANLLARILEHVLVKQGRYIILKLLVDDRPGNLARLLKKIGTKGANVIDVSHQRSMWLAPLGKVGLEVLLEVRDEEHGQEIHSYLEKKGYQVEREWQGDW